jgi:hypothetical protein
MCMIPTVCCRVGGGAGLLRVGKEFTSVQCTIQQNRYFFGGGGGSYAAVIFYNEGIAEKIVFFHLKSFCATLFLFFSLFC